MEAKEQGNLIGSDKVEGTAVYGANDQKIGSVERVMIDKISGKVSYAVLAFGGFLGTLVTIIILCLGHRSNTTPTSAGTELP
jgi:hypothetical protein